MEERPTEEGLQLSQELSQEDLSSPNPDQAAPLLQAQQRRPSVAGREEQRPGSGAGSGREEAERTGAGREDTDIQSSVPEPDREQSEQDRTEENDFDKETVDGETADEGLPPSKGSEGESGEESDPEKGPSDPNNNSLETPLDHQDNSLNVTQPPSPVG